MSVELRRSTKASASGRGQKTQHAPASRQRPFTRATTSVRQRPPWPPEPPRSSARGAQCAPIAWSTRSRRTSSSASGAAQVLTNAGSCARWVEKPPPNPTNRLALLLEPPPSRAPSSSSAARTGAKARPSKGLPDRAILGFVHRSRRGGAVDVICRRHQEHTGDKPVLESSGGPHDFALPRSA